MRTRNRRFSLWLSESEFYHLEKQAEKAGLKKEPFIRKLIMGSEIRPRPPDNISELIRAVNAVGNNINQIARKVNSEDIVTQSQLEELMRLLGNIYREVKG